MKTYGLIFTNEDPREAPAVSLSPTLVTFFQIGGTTLTPPGITKPIPTVGLYTFQYDPGLTLPVYFLADGGTLITNNSQRYLSGFLDPIQQVDQQAQTLTAIGTSNIALGTTNIAYGTTNLALNTSILSQGITLTAYSESLSAISASIYAGITGFSATLSVIINEIGTTASSIGTTNVDPDTLFGYLKRLQEYNEGQQNFNKSTGVWQIETRGGTLFVEKTLTNTSSEVNRS